MGLDITRIKAILFDIDGTLRDTDDQFTSRLRNWLYPIRFLFPDQDPTRFSRWFLMFIETPGSKILSLPDVVGADHIWEKFSDYLYSKGLGRNPEPFSMIPGVMDMLSRLKDSYPLAVISSRGQRTTLRFINQFGLSTYLKCVTTSLTCRHSKPYPDPVLWAASQIGVAPQECLMV